MKHVRVVVPNNTDGTDKTEIGVADVETLPNGDMMVNLTITDPRVAELLGGTSMKGVIPRPVPSWVDNPVTPVDIAVEEVLGEEEVLRQRPDRVEEEPHE